MNKNSKNTSTNIPIILVVGGKGGVIVCCFSPLPHSLEQLLCIVYQSELYPWGKNPSKYGKMMSAQ